MNVCCQQSQTFWRFFWSEIDGLGFKDKSNSCPNWIARGVEGGTANKGALEVYNHTLPGGPSPLDARLAQRGDKSIGLVKKMQIQLNNTEIQLNNTKL